MPTPADQVAASPTGVKFAEAIAVLKGKLPEASVAWDSLAGPVHGKVFTVAGSTTTDLVADIHQGLVDVQAAGGTITDFRKTFDAAVQKHGWTYKGKRGWRTQLIFNANMRSATMAGRWQQLVANADRRPFLQYRTAGDARVRPQHRQWNGLIYPVGDVFWHTHYPPNGYNCRCTVRAYSQADLAGLNLQPSQPFRMQYREVLDADGQPVDRVPVGIDPGWDHNVGQSWIAPELALGRKLASLPPDLRGAVVDKTITPAYQQVLQDNWRAFRTAAAQPAAESKAAAVAPPRSTRAVAPNVAPNIAPGTEAATIAAPAAPVIPGAPAGAQSAQVLGFLDSAVLQGLADHVPELLPEATTIVAFAERAVELARTGAAGQAAAGAAAWPASWIDELPADLRAYRAVLWDRTAQRLVVIPAGRLPTAPDQLPTIELQPNAASEFGKAFALGALSAADPRTLSDPTRYRVISGSLR